MGIIIDEESLQVSAIPTNWCSPPSHQFPTMVTMSQQRRKELLAATVKNNFIIIEDDYEAEMNYFDKRSQSLRSLR